MGQRNAKSRDPERDALRRLCARTGLIPSRWRLSKERVRRQLHQVELATRMVPPIRAETLSRYETGNYDLHLGVAVRAAAAMGCEPAALMVGSPAELEFEDACRDEWLLLGRPGVVAAMELIEVAVRARFAAAH